jgi:hypothetical protein
MPPFKEENKKAEIADIVKQLVLAHADDKVEAVALIIVNPEGEPEIHYAVTNTYAYGVNFGLDIIKAGLLSDVLNHASKPSEDRQ